MKKFLAILLAGAMMFALTGCFGGSSYKVKNATSDEEAADISAKDYKKDLIYQFRIMLKQKRLI